MTNTGTTFELLYKRKVYDITVRPTTKKPVYERRKKPRIELMPHAIDMSECPKCQYIMVAGVCMNTKCEQSTHRPGKPLSTKSPQ